MKAEHQFQIQTQLKSTFNTKCAHMQMYALNHQDYMKCYILFVTPNSKH